MAVLDLATRITPLKKIFCTYILLIVLFYDANLFIMFTYLYTYIFICVFIYLIIYLFRYYIFYFFCDGFYP